VDAVDAVVVVPAALVLEREQLIEQDTDGAVLGLDLGTEQFQVEGDGLLVGRK
jgi:hypothetical protein